MNTTKIYIGEEKLSDDVQLYKDCEQFEQFSLDDIKCIIEDDCSLKELSKLANNQMRLLDEFRRQEDKYLVVYNEDYHEFIDKSDVTFVDN